MIRHPIAAISRTAYNPSCIIFTRIRKSKNCFPISSNYPVPIICPLYFGFFKYCLRNRKRNILVHPYTPSIFTYKEEIFCIYSFNKDFFIKRKHNIFSYFRRKKNFHSLQLRITEARYFHILQEGRFIPRNNVFKHNHFFRGNYFSPV